LSDLAEFDLGDWRMVRVFVIIGNSI